MAGISDKALKGNYAENKFKYTGKELQNKEFSDGSGLEWSDFGARMYDNQLGRWMTPDPLSEKFFGLSPYNYAANNPTALVDPDGRDITITTEDIKDKNGKLTGRNYHISVTGKVLNNTGNKNLDTKQIADNVNKELNRLFNRSITTTNSNGETFSYNMTMDSKFTVANNMDEVSKTDNLLSIDDEEEGKTEDGRGISGIASLGGLIGHVGFYEKGGGCTSKKPDYDYMIHTAVHEFLHNMGVDDLYNKPEKDRDPNSYMDDKGGRALSLSDYFDALNSEHNRGENSSKRSDIQDSHWFNTSNLNPYRSRTIGSDGRVPKIVKSAN